MAERNPICTLPFIEVRISPNGGFLRPNGQPVVLDPTAYVPHSAVSQLDADPPDRFFNPNAPESEGGPACTHLWFYGDGRVMQIQRFSVPAWGNGDLNRADGPQSSNAIVREWYRTHRNPNWDTLSSEFAGFGDSGPGRFSKPTDAQLDRFCRVAEWWKAEGWIDLNPDNVILHRQISATACPDGRFDAAFLLRALGKFREDQMTPEEVRKIVAEMVFGSEERVEELAGHLALEGRVNRLETDILNPLIAMIEQHVADHPDMPADDRRDAATRLREIASNLSPE